MRVNGELAYSGIRSDIAVPSSLLESIDVFSGSSQGVSIGEVEMGAAEVDGYVKYVFLAE